jgi:serine/threonine protein kinase
MPVDTIADFTSMLAQGRLLGPPQLEEIATHLQSRFPEPRALAAELLRRDWLTPFQVNQLFKGRGEDLLLGSYVLLERLGAGGMGEVYKARNWKLGKIVALKLIRPERLRDNEMLRRFQREVRAAAQLNHPNVVHAYDCDEADGKHFLVLEFVDGIDLARYVKKHGPLPVPQACDCIRQAALGLQHAYERGLVHRDIKPHNLLLTGRGGDNASTGAMVKILDMGLARLSPSAEEGEATSSMTEEGMVMGTVDYMAPEQALDAHTADTRADLYSLGCTFYFLLTGQVPFPGGSAMEKLLKHQNKQPTPVEQLRQETPLGVAAIIDKLMAKRPEDRYQTPAEAATDLSQTDYLAETAVYTAAASLPAPTEALADTSPSWSSIVTPEEPAEIISPSDQRRMEAPTQRRWLLIAGGTGLLALLASLPFLFRRESPPEPPTTPSVVEQTSPKEKPPPTFDEWVQQTSELPADRQIKEVVAMLKKRNPGFDGTVTPTIKGNLVIGMEFHSEHVLDLRPLRGLPQLQSLVCPGAQDNPGKLSSLAGLKGMKLTTLNCSSTRVADLSPLSGMPLQVLHCAFTNVTDLSPLRGMPLQLLHSAFTNVTDLSPLRGMQLTVLNLAGNAQLKDLSPLRGMPLTTLLCGRTKVADLSPLRDMPLMTLNCPVPALKDHATLRTLKNLKRVNNKPIAAFWREAGKGAN